MLYILLIFLKCLIRILIFQKYCLIQKIPRYKKIDYYIILFLFIIYKLNNTFAM